MALYNPKSVLLSASGVATSFTGTALANNAIHTITIPAGMFGPNDMLVFQGLFTTPAGNAGNNVARLLLGGLAGTAYADVTVAANSTSNVFRWIQGRGVTNSQVGHGFHLIGGTITALGTTTSAIDMTAVTTIVVAAFLLNAADTMTCQMYSLEHLKF